MSIQPYKSTILVFLFTFAVLSASFSSERDLTLEDVKGLITAKNDTFSEEDIENRNRLKAYGDSATLALIELAKIENHPLAFKRICNRLVTTEKYKDEVRAYFNSTILKSLDADVGTLLSFKGIEVMSKYPKLGLPEDLTLFETALSRGVFQMQGKVISALMKLNTERAYQILRVQQNRENDPERQHVLDNVILKWQQSRSIE